MYSFGNKSTSFAGTTVAPVDESTLFAVPVVEAPVILSRRPALEPVRVHSACKRDHTNEEIMAELAKSYVSQSSEEQYLLSKVRCVLESDQPSEAQRTMKRTAEDMFGLIKKCNKKALEKIVYDLTAAEFFHRTCDETALRAVPG